MEELSGNMQAYQQSIFVRGASIYLLGPTWILGSHLFPWKEKIKSLQNEGEWMDALHIEIKLYDGNAQGVISLPRTLEIYERL